MVQSDLRPSESRIAFLRNELIAYREQIELMFQYDTYLKQFKVELLYQIRDYAVELLSHLSSFPGDFTRMQSTLDYVVACCDGAITHWDMKERVLYFLVLRTELRMSLYNFEFNQDDLDGL